MKRILLSLACAALALALATVDYAVDIGIRMVGYARSVYDLTISTAVAVFAGPVPMRQPDATAPERVLRAAELYLARQVKRDRPTITASWRMCPSG